MTNKRGNSWEGRAVIDGKLARRSFKTLSQAAAFERYPLSADRTVEQEFRIAFDILWRGVAKDERGIYRTIELLIDAIGRTRFIWSIDTNDIHNLVLAWKKKEKYRRNDQPQALRAENGSEELSRAQDDC
jgi:hypothetical protein